MIFFKNYPKLGENKEQFEEKIVGFFSVIFLKGISLMKLKQIFGENWFGLGFVFKWISL